jgi:hypothetical protein
MSCNIFEEIFSSGNPLGPTQPRIQQVPEIKRPGRDVVHSRPSVVEVKNKWSLTSTTHMPSRRGQGQTYFTAYVPKNLISFSSRSTNFLLYDNRILVVSLYWLHSRPPFTLFYSLNTTLSVLSFIRCNKNSFTSCAKLPTVWL